MRTGGVTLATAISDTHECSLRWHAMPQYHDDDAQASRSSRPTPFPHRCRLCHQLQPKHMVWTCPARWDCHYCRGRDHLSENCNNPHAICFTKSECIVPFTHRHVLRSDFIHTQIRWTASFLLLSFLTLKPMYDTIWCLLHVRYDLVSPSCTIRSCVLVGYDVISRLVPVRYQSQSHIYYDT